MESRLDDKLKRVDISLDDTEGYTMSVHKANQWQHKVMGSINLLTSSIAFADVLSGDRILLTITKADSVLLATEVIVFFEDWNRIRFEGFEPAYCDRELTYPEEMTYWAQ